LNNIVKIIGAFLLSALVFYYIRYNLAQNKIYALENEKNTLKTENARLRQEGESLSFELNRRNENVKKLEQRAAELQAAVKTDTSGFNWNYDIYGNAVIVRLRNSCLSCAY
jgi:hypothetical protein